MDATVTVLNELIETSKDGQNGFKQAAEKVSDSLLKSEFTSRAEACARAATQLQELVRSMGGNPDSTGHVSGAIHRGWMSVRAAVGSDTNLMVLEEVERGEDVAKAAYNKALKADLPPQVRTVVEQQYQGVLKNHDRVKQLRNQYRATS